MFRSIASDDYGILIDCAFKTLREIGTKSPGCPIDPIREPSSCFPVKLTLGEL
jgi:hypothetical protein